MGKKRKNLSKNKRIKKIISTSTTGLVLLSSLANPLAAVANTVGEKQTQKTVSSSTESKQLTTDTKNLLQNTIESSTNEKQQTRTEEIPEGTSNETAKESEKNVKETEQEAKSSEEVATQNTSEQKTIDSRREIQGTSEIQLNANGKTYMRVTFTNGRLTFHGSSGQPDPGNYGVVARVKILRNNTEQYVSHIFGETNYNERVSTYEVQEGDTLSILTTFPTELINSPALSPDHHFALYTYTVSEGKLLEVSQVAQHAVQELYEDEAQTIVKRTLLQSEIDSAREKVNAIEDGVEKKNLLAKVNQAYNGLQEITLNGLGDHLFARVTVTKGKLLIRTEQGKPHEYFNENYAEIAIRRGEGVFHIEYYGNEVYPKDTIESNIQDGDTITIMKKEPDEKRYVVNHPELKPNESGNYTYVVQDGMLIEASRKLQLDAQNAVKGLYEDEAQTIVKKDLLQETIDAAREKVNALPDGEEKTALLEKVDEAYNGLQEFQMKGVAIQGIGNILFSRITVTRGKMLVNTATRYRPHPNFQDNYATIQVTRGEENVYSKEYKGNVSYQIGTDEIDLQDGDIVTITKKEATDTRFIVNHPELKPNKSGNYTYVVQDGLLIEASRKTQLDAQNAVKELYEDEAQTIVKKDLLQTTIDAAREKVNVLPDSEEKTALLAKVDQAYHGLQEFELTGCRYVNLPSDILFSRITVTRGKMLVQTLTTNQPHPYFPRKYASIQVTREEETVYSKEYIGTANHSIGTDEIDLQNGDIVRITKEEAGSRFFVNHDDLKPDNSGNYTYVVQEGLLVDQTALVDAQNAVKGLYEDEAQTIVKKDLLQETIDAVREKVNVLPDSEEKTALLAKVDQAYHGLQEFELTGCRYVNLPSDILFSRITVTRGKMLVQTLTTNQPHPYFPRKYASIQVTREEETVYSKEYIGTANHSIGTDEIDLQNGDIVRITKEEAGSRFFVNHDDLKPDNSGNYTYVVQEGLLVDQTVAFTAANTAVNNLFEGEEPKDTNTQEQIEDARTKVNALLESSLKQQLLAKVEQAQEKFDSLMGTVTAQDYRLGGTDNYVRGTVTGNVEYLRLEVNGTLYAKSTVKDSDFAYYALDKIKKADDQAYIVAYNPEDREIARQQVNIIAAQGELTVQPYALNGADRYIRGTVSGEIDHIRLRVNDQLYAKSTIKGDTFQYFASDKINNVTDKVELVAYDRLGNIVTEQTVAINEIASTLTVDKYVLGGSDRYIRGTYTGSISYLRLEVNGTLYAKAGVKGNPFQYYAVDKIKSVNDQVSLIAYDENDQEVTRQTVNLEQIVTGTVTPQTYTLGGSDRYVRGTYTGDVDHLRLEVNGKLYAKSTVTGNTFQYYAVDKITNATDDVNIIAYDVNGVELAKEKVTIQETQPITLTTQKYTVGGTDKYIRGTYEGTVDHFRLEVNGKLHAKATAKGSPYQYYAVDKITNKNDQVYMIAYDANGKELAKEKVTLETVNQGTLTVSPYVINGGDNYLRGEYTGAIDHLRLEVAGKLYAKATVKGSPFRYYAVDKIKNTSDQVYIIGYDSDGVELDRQLVEVQTRQ